MHPLKVITIPPAPSDPEMVQGFRRHGYYTCEAVRVRRDEQLRDVFVALDHEVQVESAVAAGLSWIRVEVCSD